MSGLSKLQAIVAKALIALVLVQFPILLAIEHFRGQQSLAFGSFALLFASIPVGFYLLQRPMVIVGQALAITLVGQAALLVYLFKDHPWQVEMHFYFFVVLAMLAGFCERSVLLLAAGLTAAHHLILNGLLPDAIYPGGGNLLRLGMHAWFVVS